MAKNKYQLDRLLYKKTDDKSFHEIIKLVGFFSAFIKYAPLLGVLLIFKYCFIDINYIPKGLSISDSLVYIFVSVGFGIFIIFFTLLHVFSILFLSSYLRKRYLSTNNRFESCFLIFMGFVFLFLVFFIRLYIFDNIYFNIILLFVYFVIIYFSLIEIDKSKNSSVKVFFGISLVFFNFVLGGVSERLLDKTLSSLSIKNDHTSIRVTDKDFLFINDILEKQNLSLKTTCDVLYKTNIIHDVRVLWGIGQESFLDIEGVRFSINNDNLTIIKNTNSPPRKCVLKKFRWIFDEGAYHIQDSAKKEVDDFVLKYPKESIKEITIYGLTDLKPYKKGGNKKLSEKRAESVVQYIKEIDKKSNYERNISLKTKGLANFEYNPYCKKNILPIRDLKDCDGINRGVILELELDNKEGKEDPIHHNNTLNSIWSYFSSIKF